MGESYIKDGMSNTHFTLHSNPPKTKNNEQETTSLQYLQLRKA